MATERPRIYPYPRSQPAWSKGHTENSAAIRFPRDQLLALFLHSEAPEFYVPAEELAEVTLPTTALPVLTAGCALRHNLGEEVNSREKTIKVPDWYSTDGQTVLKPKEQIAAIAPEVIPITPKPAAKPAEPLRPLKIVLDPTAVVRNLPRSLEVLAPKAGPEPVPGDDVFEERYSAIDVEMEKKLKAHDEEGEEMPEWAESVPAKPSPPLQRAEPVAASDPRTRRFSIQLLQRQITTGDPFARLILDNGTPDSQGFTHLQPFSLPMEKVWYYKDPQQQVQGPFTTIEMYSWNIMGYFPVNLQVAWRAPVEFKTLVQLQRESGPREESEVVAGLFEKFTGEVAQKPANAKTVHEIEKSATKWGNAYDANFPVFSQPGDTEAAATLKSLLGIKSEAKPTPWGLPSKPQAKSLVEIQKEQKETRR